MVNVVAIAAFFGVLLVVVAVLSICCVMVRMTHMWYSHRYQSFGQEGEKGVKALRMSRLKRYDSTTPGVRGREAVEGAGVRGMGNGNSGRACHGEEKAVLPAGTPCCEGVLEDEEIGVALELESRACQ